MRQRVTDVLEIAGLVFFAAAGSVEAWKVAPAAGLAAAGLGCLAASAILIVTALGKPKKP